MVRYLGRSWSLEMLLLHGERWKKFWIVNLIKKYLMLHYNPIYIVWSFCFWHDSLKHNLRLVKNYTEYNNNKILWLFISLPIVNLWQMVKINIWYNKPQTQMLMISVQNQANIVFSVISLKYSVLKLWTFFNADLSTIS